MKSIPGYENRYIARHDGRVWSLKKQRWLKQWQHKTGYMCVILYDKKGNRKNKLVHRLIAETFIPKTKSKIFVNHLNGIKTDNHVDNLEWCSKSENAKHAFKIGIRKLSDNARQALKLGPLSQRRLTMRQAHSIRLEYAMGNTSYAKLASKYNVGQTTIESVVKFRYY